MRKPSRKLLKGKKHDILIAQLAERLDADGAAALWARAESRLDGMLGQSRSLPEGEKPQMEKFVLPTCALHFELVDAFSKDEALRMIDVYMAECSANASKAFGLIVSLPGGRGFFMHAFGKVLALAFGERRGYERAGTSA